MINKIKQYFKSWTINFGLLLQLVAVGQVYIGTLGNPLFTAIIGVVVVALRFKTTQAINDK